MTTRDKRTLTSKEKAAVAAALALLVAALVIAGGIVFGGWLAPGEAPNRESAGISPTTQNETETTASNANPDAKSGIESAASGTLDSPQEAVAPDQGQSTSAPESADATSSLSDDGTAASPSSEGDPSSSEDASHQITVALTIDTSRAHNFNSAWPSSMGSSTLTLEEGASVYDALCQMGVAISGDKTYVRSINGLSEFACGSKSGWVYQVNGATPNKSCGYYTLNGGESITWIYTCDYESDGSDTERNSAT